MESKLRFGLFLKILMLFVVSIVGSRLTGGYFMAGVVFLILWAAMTRKNGWALLGYVFLPVSFFLNPSVIGAGGWAPLIARVGIMALPFAFAIQGLRIRSCMKVPVGAITGYMICAFISSSFGWFPMISYFKMINFILFIVGLKVGVQNLNGQGEEICLVRHGFLAIAFFIIVGSLLSYPFPDIGYSMEIANARLWGAVGTDVEIGKNLVERGGRILFSGLLNHSQVLAPMTTMLAMWVILDLLFVMRGWSWIHGIILVFSPALLFMTRSRTGLFSLLIGLSFIVGYAMPRYHLPIMVKRRVKGLLLSAGLFLFVAAIIGEINSGMISRWVLKTDEIESVNVTMDEVVASRMGLVESNMRDFKLNPYIGKGFQTIENHKYAYQQGKISILSAPIEKGVLPTMILGECGVVGAIMFFVFLFIFYGFFSKRGYFVTIVLFTTFLATNMGEASFFSPGGPGGLYWLIAIAGGMCIDQTARIRRQYEPFF